MSNMYGCTLKYMNWIYDHMWLVYSDSTRQAEQVHIGETSMRNFEQKMALFFSAIMSIFSPLGGERATFKISNESWDLKLLHGEKNSDM